MKYLLRIFFVLEILMLIYGLYYKSYINFQIGEKIIGFFVITTSFIFMPLFLYHRWNGKKLKDYTFSEENLKKMK